MDNKIEEYAKDFEKLGYTHEESIEFAKAAIQPVTINSEIGWDEFVEAFNAIGCTSFRLTLEELKEILERQENEME